VAVHCILMEERSRTLNIVPMLPETLTKSDKSVKTFLVNLMDGFWPARKTSAVC